jgi:hypothetical protein
MATNPPTRDPVSSNKDGILTAVCHCGRVRVELPSKPTFLVECHCTVCYKYGGLWAYFPRNEVVVTIASDTTLQPYMRSDMEVCLSFQRCGHCGCMVLNFGEGEYAGPEERMGVNTRMLPENEIEGIEKKIIQGPKEDL